MKESFRSTLPLALATLCLGQSCTKPQTGSNTASMGAPPIPPSSTVSSCDDARSSFTMVDDWTLRYLPGWSNNVLLLLRNPEDPKSVYVRHPKENLAFSDFFSDAACVDTTKDGSALDRVYPVLAGANLFNGKSSVCPGGTASDAEYEYTFVQQDGKKHLAVRQGPEGCEQRNIGTPGSCLIIGAVEKDQVIPGRNACLAGYRVYNRTSGLKSKPICNSTNVFDQGGKEFPAGFLILREPAADWSKKFSCQPPDQPPIVPINPSPTATPEVIGSSKPAPIGSSTPAPIASASPVPKGSATPSPAPAPSPNPGPVNPPQPPCNPWVKNSCYDGWNQPGQNPTEQYQVPLYPQQIQKQGVHYQVHPDAWLQNQPGQQGQPTQGPQLPQNQQGSATDPISSFDPTAPTPARPSGSLNPALKVTETPGGIYYPPTPSPERPLWYKK